MTEDPLRRALDIADRLLAAGREREALRLLNERVLPALRERADAARRARPGGF